MKKFFLLYCSCFFVPMIRAQKQSAKTNTATSGPVRLISAMDSLQYTLGSYIALWVNQNGFQISNPDLFTRAMNDVLRNKPRAISDSVVNVLLPFYQQAVQKNKSAREEQELFVQLKDKPGLGMLPNGVRYIVMQAGKGARPTDNDSLQVNIIAKLTDGTIIEDTYKSGKPFAATVSSFFPGLNDALPLMPLGAKWQLFIPAALAYGGQGTARIPPNSALIVDVEIVEIRAIKK